jgi:hypothetical protein
MSQSQLLACGLLLGLALPAAVQPVQAIPAFARKYGMSCSTCHLPMPRLTEFGAAFGDRGFVLARGEELADEVSTGDATLQLLRHIPLALRLDVYGHYRSAPQEHGLDLRTPWVVKLLSGGPIAPRTSYYLYFLLSERGEVAGLEDAYLHFGEPLGIPVELIVGQFQVSDPLFKRELRLEYEDYYAYRVRVGEVRADLTYDRGVSVAAAPWPGGDVVFQVVNGRGLDEATSLRRYDTDRWKNVAARVSQELGPVRAGMFGYFGRESVAGVRSRFSIWGPDATVAFGDVELNLQYLHRQDDDPFFLGVSAPERVRAGFAELIWTPVAQDGRLTLLALLNWVESGSPTFSIGDGRGYVDSYRSLVAGASWLQARNIRLLGEAGWDLDAAKPRFTAGVVTAF